MSTTPVQHPFDAAIALQPQEGGAFTGHISSAYANMVGPFGGAIAATLLNAVLSHPERQGDPVAMTVNFTAPIGDQVFEVQAQVARTSRSTQHWTLTLTQQGKIATTATVMLALRQDSWSGADIQMPVVPAASAVEPLATAGYPGWVKQYDLRVIQGGFAPRGTPLEEGDSTTQLWVRDKPERPLDFLSLMALSDCFFPRVFIRRQQMMPAGTVSMTTYFHADAQALAKVGQDSILGVARGFKYFRGYFDQSAELWSATGELLATTQQLVYFKG
ncbi:MAG: thioesterase family protein [Pseudomonas sp.]|uniref:acyl-CoA thioesterase n=1 Tax=Pseudomonas sp. TaxID=306 RepID=UPI0033960495